jgi:hypothetical protein
METGVCRWLVTAALLGLLSLCGSACSLDTTVARAGIPGTTLSAEILDLVDRGSYLDARVEAGGFRYRLFFPNTLVCGELLGRDSGLLRYQWLGLGGRITDGDERCDAVGVLSLRAWRDRQPRRSREPLPRAPARFRVEYSDADLIQLRGRFPLASQLGFTGSGQLIAVVPNEERCHPFQSAGTASMEFRARGELPLTLIAGNQLCPIIGLVQPLAGSAS